MPADALLTIRGLGVEFATPSGVVTAVRGLDLDLQAGRTLAIVGESGSGKSTVAACINRLLAENGRIISGSISFEGRDLVLASEPEMRAIRGARIGLVPQDPMSNLNPLQRVGTQIREALQIHGRARGSAANRMVAELFAMAGIPDPARRARQYPHELSGGLRQRVLIAMGLACRPRLLIADEPTSALDVTVQSVILDQIKSLTREFGTAVLLITHDLALAAERADDVLVMYRGEPVELDTADAVLRAPKHDYSRRLLSAAPNLATTRLVDAGNPGGEALVELSGVRKDYPARHGLFGKRAPFVAIEGLSFTIPRGRTVAVVGESGSGKTTTAKLLLKIEDVTAGSIRFGGRDITRLRGAALFAFRRRVQPVFQDPYGSLDGRYTVRQSIEEPLLIHGIPDRRRRVDMVLDQVALPMALADRLPHELSGGQRQRVAIARALALSPELVVLDEPVSALDVIVQAQILELLVRLQRELGLSYLFISHDLAVVRMIAHEVHVMTGGRIVESGTPETIFADPQTEYTRALLSAIPGRRQDGALPHTPPKANSTEEGRPLHTLIRG